MAAPVERSAIAKWQPLSTTFAAIALATILLVWWRPWRTTVASLPSEPIDEIRPVVTLVGRQANAVISPDGSHIAIGWQGSTADNWEIYL